MILKKNKHYIMQGNLEDFLLLIIYNNLCKNKKKNIIKKMTIKNKIQNHFKEGDIFLIKNFNINLYLLMKKENKKKLQKKILLNFKFNFQM